MAIDVLVWFIVLVSFARRAGLAEAPASGEDWHSVIIVLWTRNSIFATHRWRWS
jgi:hypothetical protein